MRNSRILFLLVAVLGCSACGKGSPTAPKTGIDGTVVDETGSAVAGATLIVQPGNHRLQTDRGGQFTVDVDPGQYEVSAARSGFFGRTEFVTVVEGDKERVDIKMLSRTLSLVAYYPLDGSAKDAGPNSLDGIIHGAVPIEDHEGKPAAAMGFNGTSDFVDLGNSSKFRVQFPLTVVAWIKPESDQFAQIFSNNYAGASSYTGIWINIVPGSNLGVAYGDGGFPRESSRRSYGNVLVRLGEWQHLAAVVRGPLDMEIYINGTRADGVYDGSGGPTIAYSSGSAHIGHYYQYYMRGGIDDLYFYSRALSPEEVHELYESPGIHPME